MYFANMEYVITFIFLDLFRTTAMNKTKKQQ